VRFSTFNPSILPLAKFPEAPEKDGLSEDYDRQGHEVLAAQENK
jgi:hypothetical protein